MRRRGSIFLSLLALLTACTTPPPGAQFVRRDFADLPGWNADALRDAGAALTHGCKRLQSRTAWRDVCHDAPPETAPPEQWRQFIMAKLQPWQVTDSGNTDGLFTGYYEASLRGSVTRHDQFQYPVYGRPADLAVADLGAFKPELKGQSITGRVADGKFIPYYDRAQITAATPLPTAPVMLWADDPADVFFLQVQGSGRALLDDGTTLRLGYAVQNGRPYAAIGRVLKARGELPPDKVSMATIRGWLRDHPDRREALLNENPSYVFFKTGDATGAVGAAGTVLTPGRSLAVDRAFVPLGSYLWLDCDHPTGAARLQRLVVAEDTGGAIKGVVRGDLFWGYGAEAEAMAGPMQSRGQYFLLWPQGSDPGAQ